MIWPAEILVSMMIWINSITGLPIPDSLPTVTYTDGYTMKRLLYGCDLNPEKYPKECDKSNTDEEKNAIGLYDQHNKIIYLNSYMNRYDNIVQNSVVVHELVHHMQFAANIPYRCFGELEKVAYETQDAYLIENGREDMFAELNLSPLYLMMLFSCPDLSSRWGVPGEYMGTN